MSRRTPIFALLTLVATALTGMTTSAALACMVPHTRVFPVCEIGAPRPDERVTVVYANSGEGLSSAALGSDSIVTEVVDIEVGAADKPHYIVLSSGKAIIWRFKGSVDSVSRVVVLGSQYSGASRSGVVGLSPDRVVLSRPDMDGMIKAPSSTCVSIYLACEASAYFEIPKADRMMLAGSEAAARHHVDQFVEHLRAKIIRIPEDGWVEAESRGRWQTMPDGWTRMTGPAAGRYEPYGGTGYIETSQTHERGVISIDAGSVISAEKLRDYSVLPGAAGLQQLIARGALVRPHEPRFKDAYEKWNLALSQPYRSKLDPDFLFSYRVDYLIAEPVTLPTALNRTTLLLADGLEAPDMSSNSSACLYFADRRPPNRVAQEARREGRCDRRWSSAQSETEQNMQTAIFSLGQADHASQTDRQNCKSIEVATDVWFAGVALSEGPAWRPAAVDTTRRRVDVIVKRPGKTALYLEMWGGRPDWHILPSPQSEITTVVLGEFADGRAWNAVVGLNPAIPLQLIQQKPMEMGCSRFNPSRYAHLGGPAVQALDKSLQVLAGRGLDSLLRQTNDGSWPPAAVPPDAQHVTLVIE